MVLRVVTLRDAEEGDGALSPLGTSGDASARRWLA